MYIKIWVWFSADTTKVFTSEETAKLFLETTGSHGQYEEHIINSDNFPQAEPEWEIDVVETREYQHTVYVRASNADQAKISACLQVQEAGIDNADYDRKNNEYTVINSYNVDCSNG